jgi:CheY-like chemotaxis protein
MPHLNGYELCKSLRDDPRLKNALFIAQTGWNSEHRKKLSKVAGFHHHLVKPIDIEMLLSIIHKEFKSAKAC